MKSNLLVLVLSAGVLWATGAACDYERNIAGYEHTMCEYSGQGPACDDYKEITIGRKERKTILDAHNKLRQKIASGEENGYNGARQMFELKWDNELATIAQRWADQCTMVHDKNRDIVYNGKKMAVGQNLGQHNAQDEMDFKYGVDRWYNSELHKFSPDLVNSFVFTKNYGHFTQVVWGNTKKVGCGISQYSDSLGPVLLFVCNYAPSGNFEGEPMYEVAESDDDIGNMCENRSFGFSALCAPTDNLVGPPKSGKTRLTSGEFNFNSIRDSFGEKGTDFMSRIKDKFNRKDNGKHQIAQIAKSILDNNSAFAKGIEQTRNIAYASGSSSAYDTNSNDARFEPNSGFPSEYEVGSNEQQSSGQKHTTDRPTYDEPDEDDDIN